MYLSTFKSGDRILLGCRVGDHLLQFDSVYTYLYRQPAPRWLTDMRILLHEGESAVAEVQELKARIENEISDPGRESELRARGIIHPIDTVQIMAPMLNPEKVICVGLNYRDHCLEQDISIPENPILFSKFATAIIGPGEAIVRPRFTQQLDFEGELAFVVGKGGKHISIEHAMTHLFGYTIFNDVSARDIQFGDRQWLRGKTFDTFAPMGPFLVTKDEIADPHDLGIHAEVNGRCMQDSNTSNMIFDIPYLVHFISEVVRLSPGDIVATGTPAGVGVFRDPQVFLSAGDEVAIHIEILGVLRNPVVDEER